MSTAAQLGYLGLEVSDLGAWRGFATDLLGLGIGGPRSDGALPLRMDDRMISFCGVTPAGFLLEVGADGREVDDRNWHVRHRRAHRRRDCDGGVRAVAISFCVSRRVCHVILQRDVQVPCRTHSPCRHQCESAEFPKLLPC